MSYVFGGGNTGNLIANINLATSRLGAFSPLARTQFATQAFRGLSPPRPTQAFPGLSPSRPAIGSFLDQLKVSPNFDDFRGLAGSLSIGGVSADFAPVQGLLDRARAMRGDIFRLGALGRVDPDIRQEDVQFGVDRARDLARGLKSSEVSALRDRGLQQIQRSYLGSLRDLRRLTSDKSLPSSFGAGQKADLLKERLRSQKDLEQGLIIDSIKQQERALQLLNSIVGQDVQRRFGAKQANIGAELQERLNRLGRPELDASLKLQQSLEQARLQQQRNIAEAQQRAAIIQSGIEARSRVESSRLNSLSNIISSYLR